MLGCWSSGLRPTPSAGAGLERREGVDAAGEQHQPGEEGGDARHHRGRVGDQLAQLVAGREERDAGGDREHPGPEQQRALLARPHRRHLVEGRRLDRGVLLDDVEGEVVAREGDLDDHHAGGEQPAEGVDGAARDVDPAAVAVAPDQRRDRGEDRGQEGQHQGGAAEASWHSPGRELRRALGDQGVAFADEGAVLDLAGEDDLAPAAEGVGDGAAVGDRDALARRRRGRRRGSAGRCRRAGPSPGTTLPVSS